jgi:hypothetical protein
LNISLQTYQGFACIKEIEVGFENNSLKEKRKIVFYKIIVEIHTQSRVCKTILKNTFVTHFSGSRLA